MKIDESLLESFGAEIKNYKPKEFIFRDGDSPLYYYQLKNGVVKINHYDENGKEFIHNILGENQSFGDSLLFTNKKYPINAITLSSSSVIKLPKNRFFELLQQHPDINRDLNNCFSQHLYYNLIMMQSLASPHPSVRIKGLMEYLKSFHSCDDAFSFHIKLTRQQIADLIGLRVETVIRTLKKMQEENLLKIENKQILY
ncbi:hypothetical protein ACM39_07295 [Chryseobacterium sp. FH2]|nr:hypothetical protein ACM39_07295 [Chryseobacterium sp. FH2]